MIIQESLLVKLISLITNTDFGMKLEGKMRRLGIDSAHIVVLILACCGVLVDDVYAAEHGKIVVNSKEQWQKWKYPKDVVEINDDGIASRRISKDTNAGLDASQFVYNLESKKGIRGGILGAGSNPKDAAKILDDDMNTYWEPSLNDPLQDWWIEIDLGRLVFSTKIVLKFLPEGDPFEEFKVLVSNGKVDAIKHTLIYRTVGEKTEHITSERSFEFQIGEPRPARPNDPDIALYSSASYKSYGCVSNELIRTKQPT